MFRERKLDYRPLLEKMNLKGEDLYGLRLMGEANLMTVCGLAKKEASVFIQNIRKDWETMQLVDRTYLKKRFRPPPTKLKGENNFVFFSHPQIRSQRGDLACVQEKEVQGHTGRSA